MVAPSFQNMTKLCDPYVVNGRMYIKVKNEKTGTERQVRWYSAKEYTKAFGREVSAPKELDTKKWDAKKALGFEHGPITIFTQGDDETNEWFKLSEARYHVIWGWYFISGLEIPEDLPAEAGQPILLHWDMISNQDELKERSEIRKIVDSLLYADSSSEFQGEIGERLDLTLTLEKSHSFDGSYGRTFIYEFIDINENVYIWITGAKVLNIGESYELRGTVKEHKTYKGVKQTILTRCKINN